MLNNGWVYDEENKVYNKGNINIPEQVIDKYVQDNKEDLIKKLKKEHLSICLDYIANLIK